MEDDQNSNTERPLRISGPKNNNQDEFGMYHKAGGQYSRISIGFSAICVLVTLFATGVYDYAGMAAQKTATDMRIASMESQLLTSNTQIEATNTKLVSLQISLISQGNKIQDLQSQLSDLQSSLRAANVTLQKIQDSNARLEERVIFLVAQVEGRMPTDTGKRSTTP